MEPADRSIWINIPAVDAETKTPLFPRAKSKKSTTIFEHDRVA
jgi:hypothetical protein